MAEFNYREFLKNNPLLKEEVKNSLITESKQIESSIEEQTTEESEVNETADIEEVKPSTKMKVSEFKAKIKEEILAALTEADEEADEEEEVDVEDVEGEMDIEEPSVAPEIAPEEGLTSDEQEIQDSLKIAYDNAVQIGDDKLADQIGNTITFFTRSHVVNK
jgi:hypothetical protein